MTSLDKHLLSVIQRHFPLVAKPYSAIAAVLHCEEKDVLTRIDYLKQQKIIRQISAIFDPPAVGYRTCLVAMSVSEEHLQHAIDVINRELGVSHNYLRDDEFNIWFTIAIPPGCDMESEIHRLSDAALARKSLLLPATKIYKIAVVMNMGEEETEEQVSSTEKERQTDIKVPPGRDIELIRCVQEDLPLVGRPFLEWARQVSMEEAQLLDWIKSQVEKGAMRRFAALLRHHKIGFLANAMVAWKCPAELIDSSGRAIASQREVTHCYQREPAEGWPYNLYAMVHGRDRDDCDRVVEKLKRMDGLNDCRVLYTMKELKKERLKLFWHQQQSICEKCP